MVMLWTIALSMLRYCHFIGLLYKLCDTWCSMLVCSIKCKMLFDSFDLCYLIYINSSEKQHRYQHFGNLFGIGLTSRVALSLTVYCMVMISSHSRGHQPLSLFRTLRFFFFPTSTHFLHFLRYPLLTLYLSVLSCNLQKRGLSNIERKIGGQL